MYEQPTRPNRSAPDEYDQPTAPAAPPDPPTRYHAQEPVPEEPGPPPAPPPAPKRRRRRKPDRQRGCWGCLRTALAVGAMALAAVVFTLVVAGLIVYRSLSGELAADLEKLQSLEGVEDFETTRIYDRDGNLLYEVFEEGRRTEVPLDQIPYAVRWATIATEDDSFYENPGFDPPSILRAAYQWYREGEIMSGGSTITQQLVRQIVFSYEERSEQTLRRKLKEAALAYVMTRQSSKDEILELYLNEIYYGNLAYGIEGAADVYFDKSARDLTVGEAAFLAGLVQWPAGYDPYTNFTAAKVRQRDVLDLMVLHGYLAPEEADAAFNQKPLTVTDLASPDVPLVAPHFTVEARRELGELPGLDPTLIQRGGLEVYTTLDQDYQDLAQEIAAQHVAEVRDEYNLTNAALVVLNPYTGEVLAMLGSVDYDDESIDGNVNVVLSPQQPGSAMKPLTYALALEQGWTAADILWDVPMAYDTGVGAGFDYKPVNYDLRFHGPVRLRDALGNSYNIPAVTLLREVGVSNLLEFAQRLGIESLGDDASLYGLSLTLGGGELTPLELTMAFAAFANGGHRVEPHLINRVEDRDGNVLYEAPNQVGERVLDERVAFVISDILADNQARTPAMGAESPLRLDFPAAAKTGTTNDFRDNWTVGYTPHLVVGVWAGNTDNTPMAEGTSGLTGAAPIWHDYMTAVYEQSGLVEGLTRPGTIPVGGEFVPPSGVEQRPVCVLSQLRDPLPADEGCSEHRSEWFLIGDAGDEDTATDLPTPTAEPLLDEEGQPLPPARLEIEPGLWVIAVLPLDEEAQATVVETLAESWAALPDGVPVPSAPLYCQVPPELTDREGLSLQIFIAAPDKPVDAVRARNWAYEHSVPIEPGTACPPELVDKLLGEEGIGYDEATGATYQIDSPQPGEEVYGVIPVIGTAAFDPARVLYYKLEIGGGSLEGWVTFGETHNQSVADDVLEYLHADALPPGDYTIRLVLVRTDGNFLPPYSVPVKVVPTPPPESP
jgi:1A family penicillin-binding protein